MSSVGQRKSLSTRRKSIKKTGGFGAGNESNFWIAQALTGAIAAGSTAAQAAQDQKTSYMSTEGNARISALTDYFNAKQIGTDKTLKRMSMEESAALQAMQDGILLSNARAESASSGVLMDYGSKFEAQKSREFIHEMNLSNANLNSALTGLAYDREQNNYLVSQQLHLGEAEANDIMSHGISPMQSGITAALGTLANFIPYI